MFFMQYDCVKLLEKTVLNDFKQKGLIFSLSTDMDHLINYGLI